MLLKISLPFLLLQLAGCASWDSKEFEPTRYELEAAAKVETLQKTDSVDNKKCRKIGALKLLSLSKGQSASAVAVRKYNNATLIKHIDSRMDGGFFGEGPTDFFDVYQCGKISLN